MGPIRILTVDDHLLLREGLAAVLDEEPGMDIVAEASSGEEAIVRFRECRPDLTFMDLQMPGIGGIAAIKVIRSEFPDATIIVLTSFRGDVQANRALDAGAVGYLLKSEMRKDILHAIGQALAGKQRVPKDIARDMAAHAGDEPLTGRETEVMTHVATGATNQEIAAVLGIADETVKVHVKRILSKLRAADRTRAVAIALRRGILGS